VKNPNGYGAIVYLGKNRRKPYAIRVTKDWVDGIQVREYIDYFETKTEALQVLAKHSISPISPNTKLTFKEVYDECSPIIFKDISPSLINNYESAFKKLSPIHDVKFKDIRTAHMQKIIDELEQALSTKKKVRTLCTLMYRYALENDICNKNYAEFLKLEKTKKSNKIRFSDIEIATLFSNETIPYIDTILILIYTGFRINEFLSLTKFSVDLENNIIVGGLKTEAGENRTVPIHPKIFNYVVKWYNQPGEYLITRRESGKKMSYDYYTKYIYYPILEQLKIPRKTPHKTRHTCASIMNAAGMDKTAITAIMGHEDYAFTVNTYTSVDIKFLQNEIQKL